MTAWVLIAGTIALAATYLLTRLIRQAAGSLGLIDVPNERSSHAHPTPRGGGLAIAVSSMAAMGLLTARGIMSTHLFLAIGPGGAAVAAVGFIDDIRPLSARFRLFVHFLAAAWAVVCIGPVDFFHIERSLPELGWLGYVISTVGIVWFLNMFNFMDGIDGIAASQAVFMCAGMALLALYSGAIAHIAAAAIIIGTGSLGFLLWNWPPAKIFMGDVGSGYLGYVFAVMGLASGAHSASAPWSCLILAGVFAVDATFTVIRRFLRGERVTQAHRTHGFQLLARNMGHRNVTLSTALLNTVWLLPCGFASVLWPQYALWISVIALTPLILAAIAIGAGRRDPIPVAHPSPGVIIQFPRRAALKRRLATASHEYHSRRNQTYAPPAVAERSVNDAM